MEAPKITLDPGWSWENDPDPVRAREKLARELRREMAQRPPVPTYPPFIAALLETDYVRSNGDGTYAWHLDLCQLVIFYERFLQGSVKKKRLKLKYICSLFTWNGKPVPYDSVRTERNRDLAPALPDDLAEAMERHGYRFRRPGKM